MKTKKFSTKILTGEAESHTQVYRRGWKVIPEKQTEISNKERKKSKNKKKEVQKYLQKKQ